ncbi:MAG: dehydrogenase [Parcubacteria group bacterium Gr01-1014_30]|nr:MAG: dehydrogenase [Parcubacteria group bacterium Gr01-1014_30]
MNTENKKVGYGVVGCGRIFPAHYAAIKKDRDSQLIAVYDINSDAVRAVKEKFGVEAKNSLQELLSDPRVDVVTVCTPHHTHKDVILKVIETGKYCLCEKPICLTTKEGEEILTSPHYKDNVFVCYQNRFNPAAQFLMKLLKKGILGQVKLCSASLRWWRDNSYFQDWHGDVEKVGGMGFNQGAHILDIMRQVCGMPLRVDRLAKPMRENSNVDDVLLANVVFDSGSYGNIELTTFAPYKDWEVSLLVAGEKGTIKIGGVSVNKVEFLDVKDEELMKTYPQYSEEIETGYGNSHPRVISALTEFVKTGKKHPSLADARDGVQTTEFIEKIYERH